MGGLLGTKARRRTAAVISAMIALGAGSIAFADPAVYVVRRGDTLSRIAAGHAVDVDRLAEANHIPDPNRIAVGQRLEMPVAAGADPAEALVEQAVQLYRNARFDLALQRARQAETMLAARGDSSAPEARRALSARAAFVTGCSLAAFHENERAAKAFSRVHAIDPHFDPPEGWLSPRLAKLYRAGG